VVNMLSGGVDSTLIQTYFGRRVPALNVVPDSNAFSLGGKNAPAVAQLLGIDLQRVVVHQAEFLSQLEAAIDGRGLPPNYPQWVTLTRVFNLPYAEFVIGERADALFARPGNRLPHFARHFSKAPGSLLLPLLGLIPARTHLRRLQLLAQQAEGLRHDPLSALGFASQISIYADMALTERTFGRDKVNERLGARIEYMVPRVKLLPANADRYVRHLEVAQWRTFYNEHILLLRHLAFAYGKSLVAPYNSGPVVASALAVPPAQRYSDGLQSKYILKRLLAQRLPAYNANRKKDAIAVPFGQYYTNGPLAGVWSKYEVPDIFSGDARKQLIEQPSESTWNAVTFAIWRKRIAANATLQPTPISIDMELAF
jgi:asparagine synthetase B (glutamine-hydrolysing)